MSALLEARGLVAGYGKVVVVRDIDLIDRHTPPLSIKHAVGRQFGNRACSWPFVLECQDALLVCRFAIVPDDDRVQQHTLLRKRIVRQETVVREEFERVARADRRHQSGKSSFLEPEFLILLIV